MEGNKVGNAPRSRADALRLEQISSAVGEVVQAMGVSPRWVGRIFEGTVDLRAGSQGAKAIAIFKALGVDNIMISGALEARARFLEIGVTLGRNSKVKDLKQKSTDINSLRRVLIGVDHVTARLALDGGDLSPAIELELTAIASHPNLSLGELIQPTVMLPSVIVATLDDDFEKVDWPDAILVLTRVAGEEFPRKDLLPRLAKWYRAKDPSDRDIATGVHRTLKSLTPTQVRSAFGLVRGVEMNEEERVLVLKHCQSLGVPIARVVDTLVPTRVSRLSNGLET